MIFGKAVGSACHILDVIINYLRSVYGGGQARKPLYIIYILILISVLKLWPSKGQFCAVRGRGAGEGSVLSYESS